jgi:hypothetical protein
MVLVGIGVFVRVDDGRNVHVGRGVDVIVLVVEGIRLDVDVRVNTCGKLVERGVEDGWDK